MMDMYFQTSVNMTNIIFEGLNTRSIKDVALVSLISFIITIIFEALHAAKSVVVAKRKMNPLTRSQQDLDNSSLVESSGSQSELLSSLRIPTNVGVVRQHKFQQFALESLIHTFRFAYGYMLMLLVMSYSVWFMLAVVLGSGVGYFIFNPITLHISHIYSRPPTSLRRECCHEDSSNHGSVMSPSSVNNGQSEPLL